jgi:hypothetical protein
MTRCLDLTDPSLDGLDVADLGLLVILHGYVDAGGTCWPSQATLATRTRRTRQWVNAALLRLQKLGRIKITHRRSSRGGVMPNVYSLPSCVNKTDSVEELCQQNGLNRVNEDDTNSRQESTTPTPAREEDVPRKDVQARVVVPFGKQPVPTDWVPSAAALQWGLETYPNCDIDQFTQSFVLQCQAKGYCWADPEAAWKKWLRDDHKKFLKESSHAGQPSSGRYYPSNAEQRRERMLEENRQTGDLLKARMRARRGVV